MATIGNLTTSTSGTLDGLMSGLNTSDIISKLMTIEQQPITSLQDQEKTLKNELAAWQDANTRVLALKEKSDALASEFTFEGKSFSSGDETIVKGSATGSAQAGTYYVTVNKLARAEQDKTQGYSDVDTTLVGTGTLSIKVGDGTAKTVSVKAGANTLTGLRDAINQADVGVTATIIDDGGTTNQYHLVLTGDTEGDAGQLTLDTHDLTGGTTPTFSVMQSAQPASITLGEGAGAMTVSRNTNEIDDLIDGVTLNLEQANDSKTIMLTVKADTSGTKQAIKDFVDQYNNLVAFMSQQFAYDTTTNTGGTLFGDSTLQTIQADLAGKMFQPAGDPSSAIRLLSDIGINTSSVDNKLTIDDATLDKALASNAQGVTDLFATMGKSTDTNVAFAAAGHKTQSSLGDGYAVEVTAPATHATVVAGDAQTGSLTQDETLTFNKKVTVQLTAGMSQDDVVKEINSRTDDTGVTASASGGILTLTSSKYGSTQTIAVTSDVAPGGSGIGSALTTATAGTDVAGTINGESATGNGQFLTGDAGNTNTDGLVLMITATSAGSYGTVTVAQGIAAQLSNYFSYVVDPANGSITTAESSIQANLDQMDKDITSMQADAATKQAALVQKFADMESALVTLKSQGDYLTSQFAQANNNWNFNK